jgi:hypothetical protein
MWSTTSTSEGDTHVIRESTSSALGLRDDYRRSSPLSTRSVAQEVFEGAG